MEIKFLGHVDLNFTDPAEELLCPQLKVFLRNGRAQFQPCLAVMYLLRSKLAAITAAELGLSN